MGPVGCRERRGFKAVRSPDMARQWKGVAVLVDLFWQRPYHYYFGLWDPKTARLGKVRPQTPVGCCRYRLFRPIYPPKDPYKRAKAAQMATLFTAKARSQSQNVNSSPFDLRSSTSVQIAARGSPIHSSPWPLTPFPGAAVAHTQAKADPFASTCVS